MSRQPAWYNRAAGFPTSTCLRGARRTLAEFRKWLEPRLGPSHELVGVKEGRRAVGSALERAQRYLGLAVLAAIVLAGVAVAMAARRYSERHFDMSAILRCMGASQRDLLGLYLPQLLVIGLAASAVGCFLGWLAQYGLVYLLADLLPAARRCDLCMAGAGGIRYRADYAGRLCTASRAAPERCAAAAGAAP